MADSFDEGTPEDASADADAPDELLTPLLEEWSDVLVKHVLSRLDPTDCAMLARVAKPWLAVVVANNLPCAGKGGSVPLLVEDFVGSVKRIAWAKDNGCPWESRTCERIASGGHLDVLKWARGVGAGAQLLRCPWDRFTCMCAANGGHLETLKWAWEHGCEWGDEDDDCDETCCSAAHYGYLEILKWARERGCPWRPDTILNAAQGGHFQVIEWALQNGCEWHEDTTEDAAKDGNLEVLKWVVENGGPWDEIIKDNCAHYARCDGHVEMEQWVMMAQFPPS